VISWSDEVGAADWIVERLHPFGRDVGSLVPSGFAACCRVLHPVQPGIAAPGAAPRWRELAAAAGVELRATTRFEALRSGAGGLATAPLTGTIAPATLARLLELLTGATTTPEACWLGFWDGFAGVGAPAGPRVAISERPLALARGPIGSAFAAAGPPLHQSPTLWWPDDRAWCVATEVDFHSTYVGGSAELCRRLIDAAELEALPVALNAHVTD